MRTRLVSILLASCQEMPAASQACASVGTCGCLPQTPVPDHLQSDPPYYCIPTSLAHSKTQYLARGLRASSPLGFHSKYPRPSKTPWQTSSNQCARFFLPDSSGSTKVALYAGSRCIIPGSCTWVIGFHAFRAKLTPLLHRQASWSAGWGRRGLRTVGVRVGQSATVGAYAGADHTSTAEPVVIVFDIETTGFSKKEARIIEFAARDADGGEGAQIHSLIYPGAGHSVGRSQEAHNISDAMLPSSLPTWGDFFPKLCAWVDSRNKGNQPILFVAHNGANFDVPFIVWESARAGLEVPPAWRFVDSLKIAQKYVNAKQASLERLKLLFQVPSEKAAHRAPADVDVTLHVLSRMLQAKHLPLEILLEFAFAFGIPDKTTAEKRVGLKTEEERAVLQRLLAEGKRQRQQAATAGSGERGDGAQRLRGGAPSLEVDTGIAPRATVAREADTHELRPLEGPVPSASPIIVGKQGVAVGPMYSPLQIRPGPVLASIARWKRSREEKAQDDGGGSSKGREEAGAGEECVEDRAATSGADHGVQSAAAGMERVLPPMSLERPSRAVPWLPLPSGEESRVSAGAAGVESEGLVVEAQTRRAPAVRPSVRSLPPLGARSGESSGRGDAVGHSGVRGRTSGASTAVGGAPAGSISSPAVLVRGPVVVRVAEGGPITMPPSLPFLAGRAKVGGTERVDKVRGEAGPGAGGQSVRSRGRGLLSLSHEVTKAASGQAVPSVLVRYERLAEKIAVQSKGQSVGQP